LINNFIDIHSNWYNNAYFLCLPIIGGISGHTLGYLNIYIDAINKTKLSGKTFNVSMEIMRAIMLGALIGNKRHHSYDEVMTASVMIPDGEGGFMSYNPEGFYRDVLNSSEPLIKNVASQALDALIYDIDNPPENSTLYYVKQRWNYNGVAKVLKEYVQDTKNLNDTLEALTLISGTSLMSSTTSLVFLLLLTRFIF